MVHKWYLHRIAAFKLHLFRDLSEGKSNLFGGYWMTCPQCTQGRDFMAEHYYHSMPSGEQT
jgi:hypothetical protein